MKYYTYFVNLFKFGLKDIIVLINEILIILLICLGSVIYSVIFKAVLVLTENTLTIDEPFAN